MMIEIEWQRKIIEWVRGRGGHARKWATELAIGVPDLVVALPETGVVLAEVKRLVGVKTGFKRNVGLTPKQKHELNAFRYAGADVRVLAVVEMSRYERYIIEYDPPSVDEDLVAAWVDIGPHNRWGSDVFSILNARQTK